MMETAQTDCRLDIEARLNEAETYRSMGLLGEALAVYEKLLSGPRELTPDLQEDLRGRVRWLKGQLAEDSEDEPKSLTQKDIAIIRDAFSKEGEKGSVLDSASAFQELGLYAEALREYAKILSAEDKLDQIVPPVVECLLRIQPQSAILDQVEFLLADERLNAERKGTLKNCLCSEMERRGVKDLAQQVQRLAVRTGEVLEPAKERCDGKAEALVSSRYGGLVRAGHVGPDAILEAIRRARSDRRSVESVLIQDFGIGREIIGKALAAHYQVPFRSYKAGSDLPKAQINGLKKAFLRSELWVPYRQDGAGIEVLMEDPGNLAKADQIRAVFKQGRLRFSVGIKEDIEAFIEELFSDGGLSPRSEVVPLPSVSEKPVESPVHVKEKRRDGRTAARPLDLLSVEFKLGNGPEEKTYRLAVANYSRHGLGLLVTQRDFGVLGQIQVGETLRDMLFFASWALIKMNATVRHKTKIEDGPEKGAYVIGLQAAENLDETIGNGNADL